MSTAKTITEESVRRSASHFLLFNYGDAVAAGQPKLVTLGQQQRYAVPIHLNDPANSVIGELSVNATTAEIIDPPGKDRLVDEIRKIRANAQKP